jgi:prolipoprotein diacylglyceryltransferase
VVRLDVFSDTLNNWPRGRNSVQFVVERDGKELELPAFTPRSLGLHPTQIYESVSMVLLLFLLLSFYPFRRHDGQVFELFLVGYAVHRFLNEILRTEPVEGLNMTLSQNFSLLFLLAAIGLEIYLRKTQPKRV